MGFLAVTGSKSEEIPSRIHPYIPDKYEKIVDGSSVRARSIYKHTRQQYSRTQCFAADTQPLLSLAGREGRALLSVYGPPWATFYSPENLKCAELQPTTETY